MPPLPALAASEFLLERVQVRRPEPPKAVEPQVQFSQRLRVHGVEPPRTSGPHTRQAALAQDAKVHRNPRLGDAEFALDDGRDRTRRLLALGEKLQNPTPNRIANRIESLHASEYISLDLYKQAV